MGGGNAQKVSGQACPGSSQYLPFFILPLMLSLLPADGDGSTEKSGEHELKTITFISYIPRVLHVNSAGRAEHALNSLFCLQEKLAKAKKGGEG